MYPDFINKTHKDMNRREKVLSQCFTLFINNNESMDKFNVLKYLHF